MPTWFEYILDNPSIWTLILLMVYFGGQVIFGFLKIIGRQQQTALSDNQVQQSLIDVLRDTSKEISAMRQSYERNAQATQNFQRAVVKVLKQNREMLVKIDSTTRTTNNRAGGIQAEIEQLNIRLNLALKKIYRAVKAKERSKTS